PKIIRLDSTTSSSYAQVTPEGLFQFGLSCDHRPDLGQLKLQLSTLDPLGLPLSSAILEGSQADDPLYVPEIKKVQRTLGRHGLLYIGDCKMAAQGTRAYIANSGDYYCTPLSKVQLSNEELRELLQPIWSGKQKLTAVERTNEKGESEKIAEGFEKKRSQQ